MDNQQMGEIRNALKEAHEHGLGADPMPWPGNANLQYWVGDHYDGIGAFVKYEDAYLAAHAPTWLRTLLEERESHGPEGRNYTNEQYVRLREENERVSNEWEEMRDSVQLISSERDAWKESSKAQFSELFTLRSELAAKDKVHEHVRNKIVQLKQRIENRQGPNYHDESKKLLLLEGRLDAYEEIESILEQYARSAIVPNE